MAIRPAPAPVHPHACGEHDTPAKVVSIPDGSSPRMWGTQELGLLLDLEVRFIPTHVGNTWDVWNHRQRRAVHPHACGEHQAWAGYRMIMSGSSPRMWGTPLSLCADLLYRRFIPTHVGNTLYQKINKNNMLCFQTKATRLISLNPVQNEPKKILPSPPAPYNFVQ